jgi:hypothetical protein
MEIIKFIREITWLGSIETGWGNGYVAVPKEHPLYGKDYNNIDIDAHGGLTYASDYSDWMPKEVEGMWIIGFDCAHYGDDLETCPKEFVEAETERLYQSILNYK